MKPERTVSRFTFGLLVVITFLAIPLVPEFSSRAR